MINLLQRRIDEGERTLLIFINTSAKARYDSFLSFFPSFLPYFCNFTNTGNVIARHNFPYRKFLHRGVFLNVVRLELLSRMNK